MSKFDFNKIIKPKVKPIDPNWSDPVSFFYKLIHPEIKDLYPVQRDLLQNWYTTFKAKEDDKLISLDTGTGKTLIGLMIAESIRRETEGKVLYVCPNNLLGKQATDEAVKYGLKVASYLKISTERPAWVNESLFLENNAVCVTNYDALLNPKSKFKEHEIKGIIFDDAHLSLDRLDNQFRLSIEDYTLIKKITNIFKTSETVREKIESIQSGDPSVLVLIPPLEWHNQAEAIKSLLIANKDIATSLSWINLKDKLSKTFCFVSAKKIEISLLYPDVKNHFAFLKEIHRVYLSATLPNLDDITRVFGITPSRIEAINPDYRPQRLFILSKKTKLDDSESAIRSNLDRFSPKSFILVPSKTYAEANYRTSGALIAESPTEVIIKVEEFKVSPKSKIVLANRYDGIDLPGGICHSLVIDGLPYMGSVKTRFFSEYFHNHKNSFLRSIMASKLIQAFGRTIRGYDDYSIIFVLGNQINNWLINKDNRKFFKSDLAEDIEIGANASETINSIEDLVNLSSEMLGQTEDWKAFLESRRGAVGPQEGISKEKEEEGIRLAKKEREINDYFVEGRFTECLEKIIDTQKELSDYSRPILGLYLSMAAICCKETSNSLLEELSAQAYGINPIFGIPVFSKGKNRSLQAQRIINTDKSLPIFDLTLQDKAFDQALKILGDFLGFNSYRPENEGNGTLDVCWEDEENKIVIGLENKVGKKNKTLSKKEIDQCSGHVNWMNAIYPDYKKIMIVVGDFDSYNELASPSDLQYADTNDIERIVSVIGQVYAKIVHPEQIDQTLEDLGLRIDSIFSEKKVISLNKKAE